MDDTRWDHGLKVTGEGQGLVGHAGAVLLRKLADQVGLTAALGSALTRAGKFPLVDRGVALMSMAVAVALGATSMNDITLLAHHAPVLGPEPSDTTVRRTLELADPATLDKVARVRARVRAHVWSLIRARPAGFPWLAIAGKVLAGWLVIDLDGTLITARSDKEGAAPTFKMGYGFHPLGAWCANTAESLAMLLRPGNAGSNTFADHLTVLTAAIRQIPARMRSRLLVRVDGAGASHELIAHLLSLSSRCRTVLFTCGWAITEADEQAIRLLPAAAWLAAVDQEGAVPEDKHVAEITHLMSRAAGWPGGLRWIVRRTKPSRRQAKNLTAFERATGWRYSIIVTNIPDTGIRDVPGSHHPQFIDVLHRQHAVVEDGVLLQGSSACRMTLRRSALRRAFATHLVAVVLVVVAAQKLGQRGPATCTTTSRGDGGWMTTPLPARSAKTPDLHRFSPLENVRDTAYREDSGTGYRGSGPQVMATCRQHRDQPALPRWRHCYQPHSPGHRTRPDPHAQLPTAMRPDHKRRCRSRATRRVSRASHGDPGGGRRAPLPHRHRDRQRSGRDRPARRLGSSRAPIWTCQLASGRASRSATTSSMTCMRNAISASPRRCRFSAEHTNTVT